MMDFDEFHISTLLLILLLALVSLPSKASNATSQSSIQSRIAPVGVVKTDAETETTVVTPETTTTTTTPPPAVTTVARDAKTIYESKCSVCHAAGIAGAPKFHDNIAWKERLKAAKVANRTFLNSVKKGLNAMPPMGTCMDCTDKELLDAIDYMME